MLDIPAILASVGLPSTVLMPFVDYDTGPSFLLTLPGGSVLTLWHHLRTAALATGVFPVLLGDLTALREHEWRLTEYRNATGSTSIAVTPAITRSMNDDPRVWFRARAKQVDQRFGPQLAASEPTPLMSPRPTSAVASQPVLQLRTDPYVVERDTFTIPTEVIYPPYDQPDHGLRIQPLDTVYVALLPTQIAWHVPAYLICEAWNAAPSLDGHLLTWRWWHERHGAEIIGIADDRIEAWVAEPPTVPPLVERLAWEQQVYCQGVTQLSDDLQAFLSGTSVWAFWWD